MLEFKKLFRLKTSTKRKGVFATSLVARPAIEENFIALSKVENVQKFSTDKVKYELTGPYLIPDTEIYRETKEGEPYYVTVNAQEIVKIRNNFLKYSKHTNVNHEHNGVSLRGFYIVESWIVEDEVHDKSVSLGYNLPKGTWFITMKVEDKDYWNNYIATKKVNGFSLEALFEMVDTMEDIQEEISDSDSEKFTEILKDFDSDTLLKLENILQTDMKTNKYSTLLSAMVKLAEAEEKEKEEMEDIKEKEEEKEVEMSAIDFLLEDGTSISLPASIETEPLKVVDADGVVLGELVWVPAAADSETTSTDEVIDTPDEFSKFSKLIEGFTKKMDTLQSEIQSIKSEKGTVKTDNNTEFASKKPKLSAESEFEAVIKQRAEFRKANKK